MALTFKFKSFEYGSKLKEAISFVPMAANPLEVKPYITIFLGSCSTSRMGAFFSIMAIIWPVLIVPTPLIVINTFLCMWIVEPKGCPSNRLKVVGILIT